jgi:hypothetical protein
VSSAGTVSEKKKKRKNLIIFAVDMVKNKGNIRNAKFKVSNDIHKLKNYAIIDAQVL